MFIYIYIYIYIRIYIYIYIYVFTYLRIYVYIHIYLFTYLRIYVYTYLRIYVYTHNTYQFFRSLAGNGMQVPRHHVYDNAYLILHFGNKFLEVIKQRKYIIYINHYDCNIITIIINLNCSLIIIIIQ